MHHVLNNEIPDPRQVNPDVPEELYRIILKALSFDRADRHATAVELESELEAFLSKRAPVTSRDISAFVSHRFAVVRAERKHIVDQELQRRASRDPSLPEIADVAPPRVHDLSHSGEGSGSSTPPGSRTTSETRSTPASLQVSTARAYPPRRRTSPFVAGAILLAIGAVVWRTGALHRSSQPPPVRPRASMEASPPQEPTPPLPPATARTPGPSAGARHFERDGRLAFAEGPGAVPPGREEPTLPSPRPRSPPRRRSLRREGTRAKKGLRPRRSPSTPRGPSTSRRSASDLSPGRMPPAVVLRAPSRRHGAHDIYTDEKPNELRHLGLTDSEEDATVTFLGTLDEGYAP